MESWLESKRQYCKEEILKCLVSDPDQFVYWGAKHKAFTECLAELKKGAN